MRIYLHFTGTDEVSFGEIEDVVNQIQKVAIEQEKMKLRLIRKEIPEIPSQAVTAAIKQLDTPLVQRQSVHVAGVKPGSVAVWIAITAFGFWVLERTLGATLEETWKESPIHDKLKAFFLKTRADKLRAIQSDLNKGIQKLTAQDARKNVEIEVPMKATLDEDNFELSVRIDCSNEFDESYRIPAYDELIARDSRGD